MKFFFCIILISNFLSPNWTCLYDALGILEPSHRLSSQYSTLYNQQPKSDDPNTSFPVWETHFEEVETIDLSTSLPIYLCSMMEGILCAYVHDLCLPPPLIFEHLPNHKSELVNPDILVEHLLVIHDTDIWSPILNGNLNYLLNVSSFGIQPPNESKTFIETKVTAMKLKGFNL
jgi:hypothetical protein